MTGRPNQNDDPDTTVNKLRSIRILTYNLKLFDDMIRWWKINQNHIHADPNVVKKCDRIVAQLENYREEFYTKFKKIKELLTTAGEQYGSHGPESNEFKDVEKQVNGMQRELERTLASSGHYVQALVTRWFHEDAYFTISDVEVRGADYDFDIEIADKSGDRYDVEIWSGQSKLHHATRELTDIMGAYQGNVHSDPGAVPDRLSDVASKYGGVSMASKHDLQKTYEKLEQLRDDQDGFLIACRQGNDLHTMLCGTDFPIVPPESIPDNKCIIVLIVGGDATSGGHGTAFVVHNPNFKPVEVAKKIIRSLGFKYDQDIYTKKVQQSKQFNLE